MSSGFVSIAFSGGTVVNPIIFINSIDGLSQNFDFDKGLALTLLDSSPAGSVVLNPGNVVFNTGTGITSNGSSDDGFAVQLTGEFSSINFATNTFNNTQRSVGFTIAADVVPAPPLLAIAALALAVVVGRRRRNAVG